MKRLLWVFLITAFAAYIPTGCGKVSKRDIPVREAITYECELVQLTNSDVAADREGVTEEAVSSQQIGDLMDDITKAGWPAEELPVEIPQYTEGNVVNSGGESNDIIILVENTNPDALAEYVEGLENAGWIVTSGDASSGLEAVSGLYRVTFQWNSPKLLQIEIYTTKAGIWPYEDIPPDILPPETGTLIEEISVMQQDDGMADFYFTCDGMDEKAAGDYFQMLIDNGWSGDTSQVYKEFTWKGKNYGATIDVLEIIETRSSFYCNFYVNSD